MRISDWSSDVCSSDLAQVYSDGKVVDSIADGDTKHAPSRNAVYDALALKADATGVQRLDAELTAIAALVSAADRVPSFTGAGTAHLAVLTAAGRALIDDAAAAAHRTTPGIVTDPETAASGQEVSRSVHR